MKFTIWRSSLILTSWAPASCSQLLPAPAPHGTPRCPRAAWRSPCGAPRPRGVPRWPRRTSRAPPRGATSRHPRASNLRRWWGEEVRRWWDSQHEIWSLPCFKSLRMINNMVQFVDKLRIVRNNSLRLADGSNRLLVLTPTSWLSGYPLILTAKGPGMT